MLIVPWRVARYLALPRSMSSVNLPIMPSNTINLQGQVALITGGGRGLGYAFARALARAGAAVAITSRTESELREAAHLIEQEGGRAVAFPADITHPEAVHELVAAVEQQLGPIDLLINNAGTLRAIGSVAEVEGDAWWREMEINLRGPFICTQAVLPTMMARRRGRIINLASGAGLGPIPTGSAYCVSKAGLIRLSEIVALETHPYGIAIFAIDPGTVRTPMNDFFMADDLIGQRAPDVQTWMRQLFAEGNDTPMERPVDLVLLLASGKADALSGSLLSIHDDIDKLVERVEDIKRDALYTLRLHTLS